MEDAEKFWGEIGRPLMKKGRYAMIEIDKDANLDDVQKRVIFKIQPYTTGHNLIVTRGHSTPLEQLMILERYAARDGVSFPEFQSGILYEIVPVEGYDFPLFRWQRLWSQELHLYSISAGRQGKKINPPIAAKCLFDYIVNDHNKKGEMIRISPHIDSRPYPCPIDFSARIDGVVDIVAVAKILRTAKDDKVPIRNITVEVGNGCVHIDLEQNA